MGGWKHEDMKCTDKVKSTIMQNLGKEAKDIHLFWPIPQQEIDTNPLINQSAQNFDY